MKLPYGNELIAGDDCWDVLNESVHLIEKNYSPDHVYPIIVNDIDTTIDGRQMIYHKFPRFLTLENARALGFMPKEPIEIKSEEKIVSHEWEEKDGLLHKIGCIESHKLTEYIGKPCHVVVTINEE